MPAQNRRKRQVGTTHHKGKRLRSIGGQPLFKVSVDEYRDMKPPKPGVYSPKQERSGYKYVLFDRRKQPGKRKNKKGKSHSRHKRVKKMEKKKSKRSDLFIPAGLLVGIGVGMLLFGVNPMAIPGFGLIGLGIGFVLSMAFSKKLG